MMMISQVARFGDILNIHEVLTKLCYGMIIRVFGEFKFCDYIYISGFGVICDILDITDFERRGFLHIISINLRLRPT
jgi:hypothetical protein